MFKGTTDFITSAIRHLQFTTTSSHHTINFNYQVIRQNYLGTCLVVHLVVRFNGIPVKN